MGDLTERFQKWVDTVVYNRNTSGNQHERVLTNPVHDNCVVLSSSAEKKAEMALTRISSFAKAYLDGDADVVSAVSKTIAANRRDEEYVLELRRKIEATVAEKREWWYKEL